MLHYVRELWWLRVAYYKEAIRQLETQALATTAAASTAPIEFEAVTQVQRLRLRTPQIIPHSVRIYRDHSIASLQMQFGIQFAVNDEVLQDSANRSLITMAFGDEYGNGSRLCTADQIALVHSLLVHPERPSISQPESESGMRFMSTEEIVAELSDMSDVESMRRAGMALMRRAEERRTGVTRTVLPAANGGTGATPTPFAEAAEERHAEPTPPRRRIELPTRERSNRKVEV